jgi:hypothetical protein
MTYIESIHAR